TVEASGRDVRAELLDHIRGSIEQACAEVGDRAVALRLRLVGETALHHQMLIEPHAIREDVDALLATLAGDFWLEKLVVATAPPAQPDAVDPSVSGRLLAEIEAADADQALEEIVAACLAEVRAKMPAGAHAEEFFE